MIAAREPSRENAVWQPAESRYGGLYGLLMGWRRKELLQQVLGTRFPLGGCRKAFVALAES
jgi:hypothetical protein